MQHNTNAQYYFDQPGRRKRASASQDRVTVLKEFDRQVRQMIEQRERLVMKDQLLGAANKYG